MIGLGGRRGKRQHTARPSTRECQHPAHGIVRIAFGADPAVLMNPRMVERTDRNDVARIGEERFRVGAVEEVMMVGHGGETPGKPTRPPVPLIDPGVAPPECSRLMPIPLATPERQRRAFGPAEQRPVNHRLRPPDSSRRSVPRPPTGPPVAPTDTPARPDSAATARPVPASPARTPAPAAPAGPSASP